MTSVTIIALETKNLDTTCYRGTAALSDLARISQADVFDQVDNPDGLQRELSKKHAADAYNYVADKREVHLPRAFPEVVLNVRDAKVLKREEIYADPSEDEPRADVPKLVALTFDLDKILGARSVKVSRMDGNHRLVYAAGDGKDRTPLDASAPVQIHVGLTREQEVALFSDINANQKGLNTSHLAVLRSRITPEDLEQELHPDRAIARQLADDVTSPFHDRVHMGGSKAGTKEAGKVLPLNFIALEHGVARTLRVSGYLGEREFEGRYGLIRTYWQAVQAVYPEAFEDPKSYIVLKNLGVSTLSQVAAMVIDRCIVAGNVEVGHMIPMLRKAKPKVDWHKDSKDVAGMSGNRAVLLLAGRMTKALPTTPDEFEEWTTPTKESPNV